MRGNRNFLIILVTLLVFAIGTGRSVRAVSDQPTIEELYQKLEQRDTIIFDLLQRVEQLEKRVMATAEAATKIITVQPGDTLRKITKRAYGNDKKWQQIYSANRNQLPNPDTLEVGMKLVIPLNNVITERDKPIPEDHTVFAKKAETKIEPVKDTQIKQKSIKASNKTSDTSVANTQAKAAPGQFDVDKEAAERALERTLAQEKALLSQDTQIKQKSTKASSKIGDTSIANTQAKAAPGQFDVDEEAAERALERTLVQEGALLLRYGELEFQPGFTYIRSENDNTMFATVIDEGQDTESKFITKQKVRRDILNFNLNVRTGLPFNSQLELSIPYKYVDGSKFAEVPTTLDFDDEKTSDSGLGDIRVGLAKTLLREDGWWPDIIGRATWDSATGEDDIGGLSNGFHEAIGSLTFLKRQDPLAFVGSVGYQRSFEKNDFKPGDQLDFRVGLSLAASPETSLSFSLSQSFVYESEMDNRKIPGSDMNMGTLNIGASSIIGRRMFVNLTAGIGLTDDASDYSVGLSISKRFNWQSYF